MSGLPAGVSLEPRRTEGTAWVVREQKYIGLIWHAADGWGAAVLSDSGPVRHERTGLADSVCAVRWILLRLRPVVWQVRQHRRGRQFLGWDILDHRGSLFAPMGTVEEQRLLALGIAQAEAARLGRLRGNV